MSTMDAGEEREFFDIDAILLSLLEQELITGIEYRLVISCRQLSEKHGAIFKIMLSKNKPEAHMLLDTFRQLKSTIQPKGRKRRPTAVVNEKNPLLNISVMNCLFGFFTLKEIKVCRLVCQSWNSTAEPLLRKKAAINFKPGSFGQAAFIETFKLSLPNLPFTVFTFSNGGRDNPWHISELDEFFDKWGIKIQSLTLNEIYLKHHKEKDVSCWIEKAANLTKLEINSRSSNTLFGVQLDKLTSVKSLSLKQCCINICAPKENTRRFTPLEISLETVFWKQEDVEVQSNFLINDFIDFSQASKVRFQDLDVAKFNMAAQIFNMHSFSLDGNLDVVLNWERAKGNVHIFSADKCKLVAKNQLQFKQLKIVSSARVNLAVLPQSIEKIHFVLKFITLIGREAIQLPNLNFLCITAGRRSNIGSFLRPFSNCENLSELEIEGCSIVDPVMLNVSWIPGSVRKMKIKNVEVPSSGDNNNLELETLIVEDNHIKPLFTRIEQIMTKIQCRVLVVKCLSEKWVKTTEITKFVKKNTQLEIIVVGVAEDVDLHANTPFEGSRLSRCVDKKSNYYEFENQRGKSLTLREFEAWSNLNALEEY